MKAVYLLTSACLWAAMLGCGGGASTGDSHTPGTVGQSTEIVSPSEDVSTSAPNPSVPSIDALIWSEFHDSGSFTYLNVANPPAADCFWQYDGLPLVSVLTDQGLFAAVLNLPGEIVDESDFYLSCPSIIDFGNGDLIGSRDALPLEFAIENGVLEIQIPGGFGLAYTLLRFTEDSISPSDIFTSDLNGRFATSVPEDDVQDWLAATTQFKIVALSSPVIMTFDVTY